MPPIAYDERGYRPDLSGSHLLDAQPARELALGEAAL